MTLIVIQPVILVNLRIFCGHDSDTNLVQRCNAYLDNCKYVTRLSGLTVRSKIKVAIQI